MAVGGLLPEGGLTATAAALAWTERLRVGVGLLPVPLRNPALAAMEIATLARLFPGRLLPGLGHGVLDWMAQVGARVPIADDPAAGVHRPRCANCCTAGRVQLAGRYVQLDGVALDWPPAQVPPLLVGARGPKTLRLAGELADGVILDSDITPDGVRDGAGARHRWAHRCRIAAGDRLPRGARSCRLPALHQQVLDLAAAGADTVVLQPPGDDPDPHP